MTKTATGKINPLQEIFDMVKLNQWNFSRGKSTLPTDDPIKWFTMLSAMNVELGEALQEDKRWKTLVGDKRFHECHKDGKKEEMIDIFIYFIGALLYADIDYTEFVDAVFEKLEVVHKRSTTNN